MKRGTRRRTATQPRKEVRSDGICIGLLRVKCRWCRCVNESIFMNFIASTRNSGLHARLPAPLSLALALHSARFASHCQLYACCCWPIPYFSRRISFPLKVVCVCYLLGADRQTLSICQPRRIRTAVPSTNETYINFIRMNLAISQPQASIKCMRRIERIKREKRTRFDKKRGKYSSFAEQSIRICNVYEAQTAVCIINEKPAQSAMQTFWRSLRRPTLAWRHALCRFRN